MFYISFATCAGCVSGFFDVFSHLLTKKLVNYLRTIQKVSIFALFN